VPVATAERIDLQSDASQGRSLRRLRSNSLPMLGPRSSPLQRNAVSILSEHRSEGKQEATTEELMGPHARVQQKRKSCPAALGNIHLFMNANHCYQAYKTNEMMSEGANNVETWGNSLVHGNPSLKRLDLMKTSTPGEGGSTPATRASCSRASSACSSDDSKAPLPGRTQSMHGMESLCLESIQKKKRMRIPYAAEVFALLDKDGDRFIDSSEWSVFHEVACKGSIFHEILRLLFKAADVDHNGKLDEDEWMNYVAAIITKIGLSAWEEMANKVAEELEVPLDPFSSALRAALGQKPYPTAK